ncbi:hypothetical protein MRB53_031089 [Persea americana]|uniref:Uncharacterized protein n=1 Tax=Persea americana TaxID=3435 RepID=A0ACC2KN36_PERAE|nr:hypothetical protein MRB53_031089 [Persea americana]
MADRRKRLCLAAAACLALAACDESPAADGGTPGRLDLSRYRATFTESFDRLDVSAWGPNTRWIAHTPWHGDFGDAVFADPEPGFPFQTASGILRIEARKDFDGKWRSGLLASRDSQGCGRRRRVRAALRLLRDGGQAAAGAGHLAGVLAVQHRVEAGLGNRRHGILRPVPGQLPRQRARLVRRRADRWRWPSRADPRRQRDDRVQPLRRRHRPRLGDLLLQSQGSLAHPDAARVPAADVHAGQPRARLRLAHRQDPEPLVHVREVDRRLPEALKLLLLRVRPRRHARMPIETEARSTAGLARPTLRSRRPAPR